MIRTTLVSALFRKICQLFCFRFFLHYKINTIYVHLSGKIKKFPSCETGLKSLPKDSLFYLFPKPVQIYFIYISWNCTYNVYCICIPSSSMIVTINFNFSAITWEKVSVRWEIQLHKWLRWDILPWLWPNQPSQVALMRHITLTLT